MTITRYFPVARDAGELPRDFSRLLNTTIQGKTNNRVDYTLKASTTVSTLIDARIGLESSIDLMAMSSEGAVIIGAGYWIIPDNGQAVITHSVTSTTAVIMRATIKG